MKGLVANLSNENLLLETILRRVLPNVIFPGDIFSDGKVRAVLSDCNYDDNKDWRLDAGMAWARRHIEISKEPTVIIGFDREAAIRKRAEGSLLQSKGIAYVKLPANLREIKRTIDKLRRKEATRLDTKSVDRNIADFQKELRSDFCHGAFGSIQRNFKGALTCINEKRYSDAARQLIINLESYERAKASLERIKSAFPLNYASFNSISEMLSLIEKIEPPTRKAIILLESKPLRAGSYLKKINEALTSLENTINAVAPKGSRSK